MIDTTKIILDRVEVIHRVFDKQGRVVTEQVEYYSVEENKIKNSTMGFKLKPKLLKKKK